MDMEDIQSKKVLQDQVLGHEEILLDDQFRITDEDGVLGQEVS